MEPDDTTLASEGCFQPAQSQSGRILLIGCGALAREILAVIRANRLDHMELRCLPAILHNTPERIVPAVRAAIEAAGDGYDRIFLLYGDCGTGGGLARLCAEMGVEMLEGPHCYAFFEGVEAFAARGGEETTAFYLTDFLVRQFDSFVWKPLGLDRHPELRDVYFGNYEKLIYMAQTDDPALDEKARRHAGRLGLAYERRITGYGDLEASLARLGRE